MTPLFILGVPRSGTTLLRALLGATPTLYAGPESPWITGCYGDGLSFRELWQDLCRDQSGPLQNHHGLTETDLARSLGTAINDVLTTSARAAGKARWVEKTPDNIMYLDWLTQVFPEAQYIHIVRDGRDVACSTVRERDAWGRRLNTRDPQVRLDNTRLNALARWCTWTRQVESLEENHQWQGRLIRYEELVASPLEVINGVLSFLDQPTLDKLPEYDGVLPKAPAWESGSRDVSQAKSVHGGSLGRWAGEFTDDEKRLLPMIANDRLRHFGYPIQEVGR